MKQVELRKNESEHRGMLGLKASSGHSGPSRFHCTDLFFVIQFQKTNESTKIWIETSKLEITSVVFEKREQEVNMIDPKTISGCFGVPSFR